MGALKLHTLKQKLWAIVGASFIARVIMFFALPSTPSYLAPDEGTYAFLTRWIGQSKPASEFPASGQGLYLSGRTIILPASLLYRAGVNELDSLRLVASTYGFCLLVIVVLTTLKLYNRYVTKDTLQLRNEYLIIAMILIFAFLPSHFVWSNLALRESPTEFWLLIAFISFFVIFHQKNISILTLVTLTGSIALTFSARPQVGWVLGVTLIVYLVFHPKQTNTYFILPVVLCAVVLGSTINLGSTVETGSTVGSIFNPLLKVGETVEHKQKVNQVGAASVIETQSCPIETPSMATSPPTKFATYFCIAWRAPYMVSTFLFRPILGVDVKSTSSLFAAIENLVWLGLFVSILGLLFQRRAISFLAPLLPTIIFLFLYVLGASAYQGNMGTGFRHKSLVLWVVLLLIFALAWKKPEEVLKNPRSNSPESAV